MLLISLLTACALFTLGLTTGQDGRPDLKESAVEELLKCINALSIDYRLYVDADGHIIVIPAGKRTIDLMGTDQGLAACMQQVLGDIMVIAESSEFENPLHDSALATGSVDFTFLQENGAKGQSPRPVSLAGAEVIGNVTNRSEHRLGKRCVSWYGAFVDELADCRNANYLTHFRGICESVASNYQSVYFYNPDACGSMLTIIWRHHACTKGDARSFYVGARGYSDCMTTTVYSYKAF